MKFIRFKDIPENEISGIYDGDLGKIGEELGVSCYNITKKEDFYKIIIPSLSEGAIYDLLYFIQCAKSGEFPIYLVEGEQNGTGTYGEPTIQNVEILNELEIFEFASPKPKFKMDRHNIQFKIKNV